MKAALFGVIVWAHGGSPAWNQAVEQAVKEARLAVPHRIVFGMMHTPEEAARLQKAVEELEKAGAREIRVVPLLFCRHSEVYRQMEYMLGLAPKPAFPPDALADGLSPVSRHVNVRLLSPLEEDMRPAEVFLDRARRLSRKPETESVLLVAHGPVSDEDDRKWGEFLERWANWIRQKGGFRAAGGFTLRDDAPPAVRAAATDRLRAAVESAAREGRPIVVPVLLARGGIEDGIPRRLKGLSYAYDGRPLLPDRRISEWIRSAADSAGR